MFTISQIQLINILLNEILETVSPEKYVQLYKAYKEKLSERAVSKWENYQVYMNPMIAEKLKNFVSIDK